VSKSLRQIVVNSICMVGLIPTVWVLRSIWKLGYMTTGPYSGKPVPNTIIDGES